MAKAAGPIPTCLDWIAAAGRWPRIGLALAAGLLGAAGQAPLSLALVALAGFALAAALVATANSPRRAAWAGWWTGLGCFAAALSWIVEPFLVDVARHGWMAPFALVLMAGGMALFWAFAAGLAVLIAPSRGARLLTWPAALALAELGRGHLFGGFPWALPGYGFAETPVLQLASLVGAYGLTLLAVALPAVFIWAGLRFGAGGVLGGAALIALAWPLGSALEPEAQELSGRPVVRLVQPNAAQHQKWDPAFQQVFYNRQLGYTAIAADPQPALTIWPETSIPWRLEQAQEGLEAIARRAGGTPVIVGARRRDEAGLAYNALALIGPDGVLADRYDKARLVPFGEFIPFGRVARLFGMRSLASQDGYGYTPGSGPRLIEIPGLGRALPLICYEAIFPQAMTAPGGRADLLLQITNDAWFGTVSGPYQHLVQARTRAVEQGLPMARVANTGISAMIDPAGRVIDALPLGQEGFLDVALPAPLAPTAYARLGDTPVWLLCLFWLGTSALVARRSR